MYTVDSANRFVQFGFDSQVIEKGRQKTMTIDMSPFFDEEPDAGPSTDAGLDAGSFDAGLPDGGVLRCACDGGCCSPGTTTCLAPNRFTFDAGAAIAFFNFALLQCGKPGDFCSVECDSSRSNVCVNGSCSCGTLTQCQPGQRCATNANGLSACVCDSFSQCQGCCAGATCKSLQSQCGASGVDCMPCTQVVTGGTVDAGELSCSKPSTLPPFAPMPGVCSSSVNCASCNGPLQCCSDMRCIPAVWPRCKRNVTVNVCTACDVVRSDQCGQTGCECGTDGQCGPHQVCDRALKPAQCKSIP